MFWDKEAYSEDEVTWPHSPLSLCPEPHSQEKTVEKERTKGYSGILVYVSSRYLKLCLLIILKIFISIIIILTLHTIKRIFTPNNIFFIAFLRNLCAVSCTKIWFLLGSAIWSMDFGIISFQLLSRVLMIFILLKLFQKATMKSECRSLYIHTLLCHRIRMRYQDFKCTLWNRSYLFFKIGFYL